MGTKMEVKTTTFSEIAISREELDAIVASFIQAQMPELSVAEVKFAIGGTDPDVIGVQIKTEPITK